MRCLVVTQSSPLRLDQAVEGIFKRLSIFIRGLALISERIDMLCLVPQSEIDASADGVELDALQSAFWGCDMHVVPVAMRRRQETRWQHYGAGTFSAAEQPGFFHFTGPEQVQAVARHLAQPHDLVFVLGLGAMAAVLRTGARLQRVFFDLNDIEHKVRVRTALEPPFWLGKAVYLVHTPAIVAVEHQAARFCREIFVCSEQDAGYLRRLGIARNVTVVPNALPMPAVPPPPAREPVLMFIGVYGYEPNRTAVRRLLTRIWPLVKPRVPTARLVIAGKGSERATEVMAPTPDMEFTGFVPDLDALYARSRVVVCPLTVGGGTRMKLIEAGSYARPMVSTRIGAEGLDLVDDVEILLREDDASFAEACIRLLQDDALCERLGTAARAKVASLYEARRVERRIADLMVVPVM
jgi:glycosyltransferase involved in cell wall biosynthesis